MPLVIGRYLSSCPLSHIVVKFVGEEVIIMEKTDKELAVELACAYISAWFSASGGNNPIKKPMSGDELDALLQNCYSSVSSLGK